MLKGKGDSWSSWRVAQRYRCLRKVPRRNAYQLLLSLTLHLLFTPLLLPQIKKADYPVVELPGMGSVAQADKHPLRKYIAEFKAVALLLWILLFYWLQTAKFQRRRHLKLDDESWWPCLDWLSIPWGICILAINIKRIPPILSSMN